MEASSHTEDEERAHGPIVSIAEFFERLPPGSTARVLKPAIKRMGGGSTLTQHLALPEVELHCDSPSCGGQRFFAAFHPQSVELKSNAKGEGFIVFGCRNCGGGSRKTYAITWECIGAPDGGELRLRKYGEQPAFGPRIPSRLITLVGSDREAFIKGRRAEFQGMGIGAFAYYRRVVENQRLRLLDEFIRVATKLGAEAELLQDLAAAKLETQFSAAVDRVKHGIPPALLIDGHNPLLLLHAALSEGLHAKTDDDCLTLAQSIRLVLTDMADRLGSALKDEAGLKAAVASLLAANRAAAERARVARDAAANPSDEAGAGSK
jgi:hypothetical protein